MKKFMLVLAFICMFNISYAKYHDGVYSATSDKSVWWWKPYTKIVIENGEVTEVIHDRIKDAEYASENKNYNKRMKKKVGIGPKGYREKIEENFLSANGNLEEMDSIAGATESVGHFKDMTKFLLEKAEKNEPGHYIFPHKLFTK